MDGTQKYWLTKILYAGWIYVALMVILTGGLSNFAHLIPLSLILCGIQNYLSENN